MKTWREITMEALMKRNAELEQENVQLKARIQVLEALIRKVTGLKQLVFEIWSIV
jgi:hypothetical protein